MVSNVVLAVEADSDADAARIVVADAATDADAAAVLLYDMNRIA